MKKISAVLLLFLLIFNIFTFSCFAETTVDVSAEATVPLEVKSRNAVLIEAKTGMVLFEKGKDEKRPIASVTKVMTMLLTMEAIARGELKYDDIVIASERAKSMGGSTMFLEAGEQITVNDLLKGIAVMSANDGCVAIAEHLAGNEDEFVAMMNKRAEQLGMVNTHFENTNGLEDDNHYSSAYDVSIMSRELLKHKDITKYTTIWMDTLRDGKFELANTNKLIKYYDGATGLKTGFTSKSMYCLSASAQRNGMEFIAVILGGKTSPERFSDATTLLNYGFNGFIIREGVKKDEKIASVALQKGIEPMVLGVAKNDFSMLVKKTDKTELTYEITLSQNLIAPIKAGDKVGKIDFYLDKAKVGTVDVIAQNDIRKMKFFDIFGKIARYWINDSQGE